MTITTTYIADDGTKFDNEWECRKYEAEQEAREYRDTALLFNEDGKRLPLSAEGLEASYYIKAVTDEAAQYMLKRFEGYSTPWDYSANRPKAGTWVYFNDQWISAEDIEEIRNMFRKIS